MNNILQDIIKCEQEASRLEEEARKQSITIISDARKKAAELMENSLIEGEKLCENLLQEAKKNAEEEFQSSLMNDEQIKSVSPDKLEAAVNLIVERVVDEPWQW